MKRISWQVLLGFALVVLSAIVYFTHFLIFGDAHHIFIYLLGDIAFVPVEVLLVTFIIHRVLIEREKKAMLKKLNMIIGSFFSEVGIELLSIFSRCDTNAKNIVRHLIVKNNWSSREFLIAGKHLSTYECCITGENQSLTDLKKFLADRRIFLLSLLTNPNLLEHETFTELLWAVFHLTEELAHRKKIEDISEKDREHISSDIKRAYGLLITEWLDYMKHLKTDYPYLFSFALRTNPFDPDACSELK